jgi:hypothetical protein
LQFLDAGGTREHSIGVVLWGHFEEVEGLAEGEGFFIAANGDERELLVPPREGDKSEFLLVLSALESE